jgi:hypothetical protein
VLQTIQYTIGNSTECLVANSTECLVANSTECVMLLLAGGCAVQVLCLWGLALLWGSVLGGITCLQRLLFG